MYSYVFGVSFWLFTVTRFYRSAYARAVWGVVILSVRLPSVHLLSRVDCDKSKWCTADIVKGQSLCYSDSNSGWWATFPSLQNLRSKWPTPFEKCRLQQISAYNMSTTRDSEKSSIMMNIKSAKRFPTSHRWSACYS